MFPLFALSMRTNKFKWCTASPILPKSRSLSQIESLWRNNSLQVNFSDIYLPIKHYNNFVIQEHTCNIKKCYEDNFSWIYQIKNWLIFLKISLQPKSSELWQEIHSQTVSIAIFVSGIFGKNIGIRWITIDKLACNWALKPTLSIIC